MRLIVTIYFAIFVLAKAYTTHASGATWPKIQPIHKTYRLANSDGNKDTPVLLFVNDDQGKLVYKLECHNGNYENTSEINYSGDLQCALFAMSGAIRTSWNLLADDTQAEQRSDSFNRGRMLAHQLRGSCSEYAEYGPTRHFRLRGMLIKFQFSELRWSDEGASGPKLKQFTLDISVVQDAQAQTPTAERLASPRPPPSCL